MREVIGEVEDLFLSDCHLPSAVYTEQEIVTLLNEGCDLLSEEEGMSDAINYFKIDDSRLTDEVLKDIADVLIANVEGDDKFDFNDCRSDMLMDLAGHHSGLVGVDNLRGVFDDGEVDDDFDGFVLHDDDFGS